MFAKRCCELILSSAVSKIHVLPILPIPGIIGCFNFSSSGGFVVVPYHSFNLHFSDAYWNNHHFICFWISEYSLLGSILFNVGKYFVQAFYPFFFLFGCLTFLLLMYQNCSYFSRILLLICVFSVLIGHWWQTFIF